MLFNACIIIVVEAFLYFLQYGGTAKSTEHSINDEINELLQGDLVYMQYLQYRQIGQSCIYEFVRLLYIKINSVKLGLIVC